MGDRKTFFHETKEQRNIRCMNKDPIIKNIFDSIDVSEKTKCLLMPGLWGPEVEILLNRGVLSNNIYSIEQTQRVHKIQRNPTDEFWYFRGINTTRKPRRFDVAVDYFNKTSFDIVYIDFYGRPWFNHEEGLRKMFLLGMFNNDANLILTFNKTRCSKLTAIVNSFLRQEAEGHVNAAMLESKANGSKKNYSYHSVKTHEYYSKSPKGSMLKFETTHMRIFHA